RIEGVGKLTSEVFIDRQIISKRPVPDPRGFGVLVSHAGNFRVPLPLDLRLDCRTVRPAGDCPVDFVVTDRRTDIMDLLRIVWFGKPDSIRFLHRLEAVKTVA